jgi:hypothetical protein
MVRPTSRGSSIRSASSVLGQSALRRRHLQLQDQASRSRDLERALARRRARSQGPVRAERPRCARCGGWRQGHRAHRRRHEASSPRARARRATAAGACEGRAHRHPRASAAPTRGVAVEAAPTTRSAPPPTVKIEASEPRGARRRHHRCASRGTRPRGPASTRRRPSRSAGRSATKASAETPADTKTTGASGEGRRSDVAVKPSAAARRARRLEGELDMVVCDVETHAVCVPAAARPRARLRRRDGRTPPRPIAEREAPRGEGPEVSSLSTPGRSPSR